jgi:hypothetical protein
VPDGSALVRIIEWPAAGPVICIGVSAVMRRAKRELATTPHLPFSRLTSMTEPPCAIISMAISSGVMPANFAWRSWRPRPGNISSSLVYSWFTTSSPCEALSLIGAKPRKSLL